MSTEKTPPQLLNLPAFDNTLEKKATSATYTQLRELRKDPTIALARQLAIAPILASLWSVEATDEAPEGAKEFIEKQIKPTRMHILRNGFLGCIDFGWQSFEKVFELTKDGLIGLKKLKPLLPDLTDILVNGENGAFAGVRQQSQNTTANIDLLVGEVLLLYIDVEGTDWYGQGILDIVKKTQDSWEEVDTAAKRYDKKIAGANWIVHYPEGTSLIEGEEVDNFKIATDVSHSLEASGTLILPSGVKDLMDDLEKQLGGGWKVELISAKGSISDFISRQKYLDALKVRAFGLPERAVLEGMFGTKAEAEAHADFAIINMEIRHAIVVELVNWHLVNQLLRFNWGVEAENTVFIKPTPIVDLVLQYLREVYSAVLASPEGFVVAMDTIDLGAMQDQLGLPIKEGGEGGSLFPIS